MTKVQGQHPKALLDTQAVARMLGISPRCVANWRSRGGGPKFKKVGRLTRYSIEDVEDFLHAQTRRTTS